MNATAGDVIQVDPKHDETFGGCLAIVEEVTDWGVSLCAIQAPGQRKPSYFYRVAHGEYKVIGRAAWVLDWNEEGSRIGT